ncbi:DUF445 domain-containing protein [Alkanindiges sp. WGS2144]|uniref:DUF445 domain-containing protein n=1 Tax=Alkanindiges sp. WGS2144 TaxID=3366808 RepID=UPI003752A65C
MVASTHAVPQLARSKSLAQIALFIAIGCWVILLILVKFIPDYAWILHILMLAAEAGVVGGLADWYAITVLFRNPFGKMPLPRLLREHTEIIPRNKSRIAESMGRFVQENFLSPVIVRQSLQRTDVSLMAGDWLANPANARQMTDLFQQAAPRILDFFGQDAISEFMQKNIVQWAKNTDMHHLSSELIRAVLENDFHEDVLQRGLDTAHLWVKNNPEKARILATRMFSELGVGTLAWGAGLIGIDVQRRIINTFMQKVEQILENPEHPLRVGLEEQAQKLMLALRDPQSVAAQQLNSTKNALLDSPAVVNFLTGSIVILRDAVKRDLHKPESAIAQNLHTAIIRLGRNLKTSQEVRQVLNTQIEQLAVSFSTDYADKVIRYISQRIHEWDSREMIAKIESEVGGDLHMIRVNGVVVGAFIGLILGVIRAIIEHIPA